jgi:hypothetical protein
MEGAQWAYGLIVGVVAPVRQADTFVSNRRFLAANDDPRGAAAATTMDKWEGCR